MILQTVSAPMVKQQMQCSCARRTKIWFNVTDPKPSDTMHQLKKVFIYLQWASLSCASINKDCCQNCQQYGGAIMPALLALAALHR
jgi:hypothetical protein